MSTIVGNRSFYGLDGSVQSFRHMSGRAMAAGTEYGQSRRWRI